MNTFHQYVISDDDRGSASVNWQLEPQEEKPTLSPELNRMLSAAVVSNSFRRLLLRDPVSAVTRGYNGESFEIPADELAQIMKIRAESLAEFATQLIERLWFGQADDNGVSSVSPSEPVKRYHLKPALVSVNAHVTIRH